jgi:tRNA (guanine-N7-)-methyltransferase
MRSFVTRNSRITQGQQRALKRCWDMFCVNPNCIPLDPSALFGRSTHVVLEIGFGNGTSLITMASENPQSDYLGIEVHQPGIGHLLRCAEALQLTNLRVINADAVDVLAHQLIDNCLDRVHIFFPDPWPKKRHRKRRLIQPSFITLLAKKLKPGACLHLATDWEDYAQQMLTTLEADDYFDNMAGIGQFAPRPPDRPLTKFEVRGQRLGHKVWDLQFRRR